MWAQKRITACSHTGTYSTRGELLGVDLPDGKAIEYVYDPLGRRIAKKINGTIVEKYLWSGLTTLLAIYDGSDNLLMRFKYADSRMPVAMEKAGATYYLAYNQVGTLRAVADSAGNIVKQVDYDSWGYVLNDSNPGFEVPYGFAGGLYDKDTGLVRFGYRDYDPDTGRWTAKDPIGFVGGDSDLYGYCLNDPVNLVDPHGQWALMGGLGVRATLPGIGGEVGFTGVIGSEGEDINAQVSAYAEAFVAGGLSVGRGLWGGLWSGDVSEMGCATEIGIDTPYGSISILFDLNKMNFGVTLGGPSLGAGAFAKVDPLHVKKEVPLLNKTF
jgi:RHS repeat-associated protein